MLPELAKSKIRTFLSTVQALRWGGVLLGREETRREALIEKAGLQDVDALLSRVERVLGAFRETEPEEVLWETADLHFFALPLRGVEGYFVCVLRPVGERRLPAGLYRMLRQNVLPYLGS